VALVVAYAAIGLAAALWVLARRGRAGASSALACVWVWPLWLPFAFAPLRRQLDDREAMRILRALEACREDLDDAALAAISADVARIAERRAAVDRELARLPDGAVPSARLVAVRDRDAREMAELVEVAEQLRTELMLARYGAAADARGLVDELSARVEALRALAADDRRDF
jgi:hypothetical protein